MPLLVGDNMYHIEALSTPSYPPPPPPSKDATVSKDTVGEDVHKEAQPVMVLVQSSESTLPHLSLPSRPNSVVSNDAGQALEQVQSTKRFRNVTATPSDHVIEHTHLSLSEKNVAQANAVADVEGNASRSESQNSKSAEQRHMSNRDAIITLTALSTQSLTPLRALSPSSQSSSPSQHVSHRPISYLPSSDGRPREDVPYDSPAGLTPPVGFAPISGPNRRTTMYFDSARINRDSVISYDSRDGDKARQKDRTCWQAFKQFLQRSWNS